MTKDKDKYIKFLEDKIESLENIIENSNSFRDLATELYKRDIFESNKESLAKVMIKDRNNNIPWSVLFCDINNLKQANDFLGHTEVDKGIKAIADILKSQTRSKQRHDNLPKDIIINRTEENESLSFRIGGDEFIVLLPHCSKIAAHKIEKRIKSKIDSEPIEKTKGLSLSIGVVSTLDIKRKSNLSDKKEVITFISDLIALADKNMYKDKVKHTKKLSAEEKNEILIKSLSRIGGWFNLNIYKEKDLKKFKKMLSEIKIKRDN